MKPVLGTCYVRLRCTTLVDQKLWSGYAAFPESMAVRLLVPGRSPSKNMVWGQPAPLRLVTPRVPILFRQDG